LILSKSLGGAAQVIELPYVPAMRDSTILSIFARLIGNRYRELPGFGRDVRLAIEKTLAEFGAEKYGEAGSPAYEINNEYFRIGGRKLRVCTEDEMFVSLWGGRELVDRVYARVMERLGAMRQVGGDDD
jgi:hypothetical protein